MNGKIKGGITMDDLLDNNEEIQEEQEQEQEVENTEEEEVIEEKPVEEKQDDRVPLATLLEEKKRRKEIEKRLRELEEKELDHEILIDKKKISEKYINSGYEEALANMIAEDVAGLKRELRKNNLSKVDYLDEEIQDLSRDVFYSDASSYGKEIKSKITEFKTKGIDLSVEDAYNLVRNPRLKFKEIKEDTEQKDLLNRRQTSKTNSVPNASASAPKNPYPLTSDDKKALAKLQEMQPNNGWDVKKFYEMMYKK